MRNKNLEDYADDILSARGQDALDKWSDAVADLEGDLESVREVHSKVGAHLAEQINNTKWGNKNGH